jgi:hypothetical protein
MRPEMATLLCNPFTELAGRLSHSVVRGRIWRYDLRYRRVGLFIFSGCRGGVKVRLLSELDYAIMKFTKMSKAGNS